MTTSEQRRRGERHNNNPPSSSSPSSQQAFRHVKAKALRALDNSVDPSQSSCHDDDQNDVDKSPKGSIDLPILNLVRRLNEHPDYATTSSCSGRISLFDPTGGGVVVGAATTSRSTGETDGDGRGGGRADLGDGTEDRTAAATVDYQSKRNVPSIKKHAGATGGGGGVGGGKGRGTWLLSSHGPVSFEQLERALTPPPSPPTPTDPSTTTPLTLKFEPLVMHVACASSESARVLLSTALGCGYRESGTVFGSRGRKITVAIRSHSSALAVPLSRVGPLRPGREYLRGLVGVMNDRFARNADMAIRLEEAIERALFSAAGGGTGYVRENPLSGPGGENAIVEKSERVSPTPSRPSSSDAVAAPKSDLTFTEGRASSLAPPPPPETTTPVVEATFRPLPPLRLWGHAAVAVPRKKKTYSSTSSSPSSPSSSVVPVDVLAIGGYGLGPPPTPPEGDDHDESSFFSSSSSSAPCRRFDSVFRLSKDGNGLWDDRWRREPILLPPREGKCESASPDGSSPSPPSVEEEALTKALPVEASLVTFHPLQGHAACLLPPLMPGEANNAVTTPLTMPPVVAVFGGRSGGPARAPSNALHLYCHRHHLADDDDVGKNSVGGGDEGSGGGDGDSDSSARSFFCRPIDVRGAPPRRRWGHTFTAISSNSDDYSSGTRDDVGEDGFHCRIRHLALVVGGMDESKRAFGDAHVLTLVSTSLSSSSSSPLTGKKTWSSSFLWQELDVTGSGVALDGPLFYHTASEVPAHSEGVRRLPDDNAGSRGDVLRPPSEGGDVPRDDDDEEEEHPLGIFIFGGLCNPAELFPQHDPTRERSGSVLRVLPSEPCHGGGGDRGQDRGSPSDERPTGTVMATCSPLSVSRPSLSPRDGGGGSGTSQFSPSVTAMLGGFGSSACTLRRVTTTTCDDKLRSKVLPSCAFESTFAGYVAVTGGVPLDVAGTGLSKEAGDDEIPLAVLKVSQQRRGDECSEADDRDGTTAVIPCRVRWKVGDPRTESWRPTAAKGGRDEDNSDASFAPPPPLNLGALVHHAALSIEPAKFGPPGEDVNLTSNARLSDIILVGGGVPSFAFGSTFASCYSITLQEVDA